MFIVGFGFDYPSLFLVLLLAIDIDIDFLVLFVICVGMSCPSILVWTTLKVFNYTVFFYSSL